MPDQALLKDRALLAARKAYAPYSGMFVGAAVATRDDRIVTGANVENASYGLTICAERAAIFAAIDSATEGTNFRDFVTDVVAMSDRGEVLAPCGACRQVILEFGSNARILLPSGRVARAKDTLVEGFEFSAPTAVVHRRPSITGRERDQIVQLLTRLRTDACTTFGRLETATVRSCILLPDIDDHLVIPPGLHDNFDPTIELSIRVPIDQGISGRVYAHGHDPNAGSPGKVGNLPGEPIDQSQNRKVADGLFWIVAWPLRRPQSDDTSPPMGVVSLDGFDQIDGPTLTSIRDNATLAARALQIARALARILPQVS